MDGWLRNKTRQYLRAINQYAKGNCLPLYIDAANITPVFIIGCGRSGNTLMRRLLMESGQITIPPETYVLKEIIRFFWEHSNLDWQSLVRHSLAKFSFHPEFVSTFGYDLYPLSKKLLRVDRANQSLATLLNAFYIDYAERTNSSHERWGDKTPLNTFALSEISSVFPRAQYIEMTRDPVDVVASYISSGLINNHKDAAVRWKRSIDAVSRFRVSLDCPGVVHTVQYEALVTDTEHVMRDVCKFLGFADIVTTPTTRGDLGDVPIRAHHSNVLGPISASSIGKGRRDLSLSQVAEIEAITGFGK